MDHSSFDDELRRTAFQKKAVARIEPEVVLQMAIEYFNARGYRSAKTGRPNHVFVIGGREGQLPRVTGEIAARGDVGRPGTTLVTLDAAGERLGPAMQEFLDHLRAENRKRRAQPHGPGQ